MAPASSESSDLRAMRRAEYRLLECSHRYCAGTGTAGGASEDASSASGPPTAAILVPLDTPIPRSVLPHSSSTAVTGADAAGTTTSTTTSIIGVDLGLSRARTLRRMGSSLLAGMNCAAPDLAGGCYWDGVGDDEEEEDDLTNLDVGHSGSADSLLDRDDSDDGGDNNDGDNDGQDSRCSSRPGSRPSSRQSQSRPQSQSRAAPTRPSDEVLHVHAIRVTSSPASSLASPQQEHEQQEPEEDQEQQQQEQQNLVAADTATDTSTATADDNDGRPPPSPQSQQPQTPTSEQQSPPQPPLVLLHGYANGALYFYRNLHGLSDHFDTVYAVDMMGWGLSSRPPFPAASDATGKDGQNEKGEDSPNEEDQSVRLAEDFFVESLEAWRAAQNIESMILGGHSLGGYISVAYTERYPHRVSKLLLLSPVGVAGDPNVCGGGGNESTGTGSGTGTAASSPNSSTQPSFKEKAPIPMPPTSSSAKPPAPTASVPIVAQVAKRVAQSFFDSGWTPGAVIRTITKSQGLMGVESYVDKRMPGVTCPEERSALIDYLYYNAVLPPSGECCLNRLLLPGAYAVRPLCDRIPRLRVSEVVLLYGEKDWMDPAAGMAVERHCRSCRAAGHLDVPDVSVRAVRNSGHLLMIENWEGFNAAVVVACGGVLDPAVARLHRPASFIDKDKTAALRRWGYPYGGVGGSSKGPFLAATGSETTEESWESSLQQEGIELDLTGKYIVEEEEDFVEYGKEATFTEKCTGVSIRKPTIAR